jgi:hypothetical protein
VREDLHEARGIAEQHPDVVGAERRPPLVDEPLDVGPDLRQRLPVGGGEAAHVGVGAVDDCAGRDRVVVRRQRRAGGERWRVGGAGELARHRQRGGDLRVELVEVHDLELVVDGVVAGARRVGEEDGGHRSADEVDVVAAVLAEGRAQHCGVQ